MLGASALQSWMPRNQKGSQTRPPDAGRVQAEILRASEAQPEGGMDRKRFEDLVEQALESLPGKFRARLTNVAIIVEDSPPQERATSRNLLLGLFHGVPLPDKSVFSSTPPDRIFLYQKNIEAVCSTDAEVRQQIRDTLLHEVGHYFGLTEDELRDI